MVYIDGESLHLSCYPNIDNFDDIEMLCRKRIDLSLKSKRVCLWKNKEDIWIDLVPLVNHGSGRRIRLRN